MGASIRKATAEDLLQMQACNMRCFPESETYPMKHYFFLFVSWPQVQHVAQDPDGRIVGYVLATMGDDKEGGYEGHITSIAVLRPYRRLGLATKLLSAAHAAMIEAYEAEYAYLHVRKSNHAALNLFTKTLGYTEYKLEMEYFVDGEDGWTMRKLLKKRETFVLRRPQHGGGSRQGEEIIGALKARLQKGTKAKSGKA